MEPNWKVFTDAYGRYQGLVADQKARGINDFNILNTVLRCNDEVRLHSRFIAEFLNPSGKHGQGALFLDIFLDVIGLPQNWEFDSRYAEVFKEHDYIDIYITDGVKHIIVENKIDAPDQEKQLQRYVDLIRYGDDQKSDSSPAIVDSDDTLFVYLSKNRQHPRHLSMGPYRVSTNCKHIMLPDSGASHDSGEYIAHYRNIHYKNEILGWVDKSLRQVNNLTNLNYALNEYRQVVERVIKAYRSELMDLDAFFTDTASSEEKAERVRIALELEKSMPRMKAKWLEHIMMEAAPQLMEQHSSSLTLLTRESVSGALKTHLYCHGDADRYFSKIKNGKYKDKATVWLVGSREPKMDAVALILIYGKAHLHAGVVPVLVAEHGIISASDKKLNATGQVKLPCGLGQSTFKNIPNMCSWHVDLHDAFKDMAGATDGVAMGFDKSKHAEVLIALADHFLGVLAESECSGNATLFF